MSPVLTAREIDLMRADAADGLLDVCDLRRRVSPDGPWEDVGGGHQLACRLTPGGGHRDVEALSDISARLQADAVLHLVHDAPVRRLDQAYVNAARIRCEVLYVHPIVRAHRLCLVRVEESGR